MQRGWGGEWNVLVWLYMAGPGIQQLPEPVDGQQQRCAHHPLLIRGGCEQGLPLQLVQVGHV